MNSTLFDRLNATKSGNLPYKTVMIFSLKLNRDSAFDKFLLNLLPCFLYFDYRIPFVITAVDSIFAYTYRGGKKTIIT
jgi:hypothetical protein